MKLSIIERDRFVGILKQNLKIRGYTLLEGDLPKRKPPMKAEDLEKWLGESDSFWKRLWRRVKGQTK